MKNTIAVCMTRINENFQTDSIAAIMEKAGEYGYHIQVYNAFEDLVNGDSYDQGEKSIYQLIHYEKLCGMILYCEKIKDDELNQQLIREGREHGIPVVCIDRRNEGCYNITFDYAKSFEKIVRHLIEVHHCRKFFMMAGFRNNDFSEERIEVVRRVLGEYGLPLTEDDIGYGDFWDEPARAVMQEYLGGDRVLPDAFISANDTMAITICDELNRHGYQVPDDVIVTGFDGIELEKYYVPRLTTAQQNIGQCGMTAVDIIRDYQNGKRDIQQDTVIPFSNRFAQSCGCRPIVYNSVSSQIRSMYNNLTAHRYFQGRMYEMIIELTSKQSITEMVQPLERYIPLLVGFHHFYLCVREQYLKNDAWIQEELKRRNRKRLIHEQKMIVLGEYHQDEGFSMPLTIFGISEQLPDYERAIQRMQNVVFVPLHMQDEVFGYLAVDLNCESTNHYQIDNFATNLSHSMDSVKKQYEMQLMNHKLMIANDKLEELYIRDPLTGVYNRRGFYQELHRRLKQQHYGWVLMASIDLDGLKEINDTYGHSEGDFAIKTVGRAVTKCTIENGICSRFGGDEFSVALFYNEYEEGAAKDFTKRLNDYIARTNKSSGKPYTISASCGTEMEALGEELDADSLLKKADDKMYAIKSARHLAAQGADNA